MQEKIKGIENKKEKNLLSTCWNNKKKIKTSLSRGWGEKEETAIMNMTNEGGDIKYILQTLKG